MKGFLIVFIVILGIAGLVGLNSFYVVRQDQQALVLQFGSPVEVRNEYQESESGQMVDEAGLFFKLPWEEVITLDRKNIGTDIPDIEVLASDQRRLTVDAFVRWRIVDPLKFYQRLRTEIGANSQLQRFTESNIRDALGRVPVPEIISGQRASLMEEIRLNVNDALAGTGIDIIDVRIRQADLPAAVAEGVYARMQTERQQEAQRIRSEGEERARLIRAQAERQQTVILAEANQESEQVRGAGDAQRNKIYADAYGRDLDFFRFQRALIACEEAIEEGTIVVTDPGNLDLCQVFIDRARVAGGQ
ncbi:MAG: protease modulator HflC [Ponticaulis sp.]|nr:protease modulator HflC [Ponticaulis sp.]|tara:strand:+ start:23140 stop:24051 length:912 start_codon:yes stop_codon:yes gene_type:complete